MELVEKIREYVSRNYIEPARKEGIKKITIRAGDIHKEMKLFQRMPAVCSALKTKINKMYDIEIINIVEPPSGQGANVYVTYELSK
jgi:hypothetical protein